MDITKFVYSDEVYEALSTGSKPVIALESTIISHGMPYPQNFETARDVEKIIRDGGCIPATIGILSGVIHIGMSNEQLETFAKIGRKCVKVSRRDFARVVGLGLDGATTVSGTMMCAHAAGIRMFVTGGLGGVHRGAEETWDVSADLTELGRTPVAVVCAGAKSILDIPRTLEYLETQGVMIYGWQTNEFPGFWTPSTGLPVAARVDTPEECGKVMRAHLDELMLQGGLVFAVPLPASLSADAASIELATQQAVRECKEKGVSGKDSTPFLLQRINEITKGQSLKSNIALVKNNAAVGAMIALADHKIKASTSTPPPKTCCAAKRAGDAVEKKRLVVVGGSNMDLIARPSTHTSSGASLTSLPGNVDRAVGGVGLNIARSVNHLLLPSSPLTVDVVSVVGHDSDGDAILSVLHKEGLNKNATVKRVDGAQTATYLAVLDGKGELVSAVADMQAHDLVTPQSIDKNLLKSASMVILDANMSEITISAVSRLSNRCWVDPVSVPKCSHLISSLSRLHLIKPNKEELVEIASLLLKRPVATPASLEDAACIASEVLLAAEGLRHILVSMSTQGAVLVSVCDRPTTPQLKGTVTMNHASLLPKVSPAPLTVNIQSSVLVPYNTNKKPFSIKAVTFNLPASSVLTAEQVVDVTGAGDSLLATMAHYSLLSSSTDCPILLAEAVVVGLAAARLALLSKGAVVMEGRAREMAEIAAHVRAAFNSSVVQIQQKL